MKEIILHMLEKLDVPFLVSVWNAYCDYSNQMDYIIYPMDEFDEITNGLDNWQVARACFYGNFKPFDNWFWFDGYANICSSDFPQGDIYLEEVASAILERFEEFAQHEDKTIEEFVESADEKDLISAFDY